MGERGDVGRARLALDRLRVDRPPGVAGADERRAGALVEDERIGVEGAGDRGGLGADDDEAAQKSWFPATRDT